MTTLSYRLLLFVLAFAPLAFGSVEHWSLMTVEIVAGGALFFCVIGLLLAGEPFLKVPGLVPLGLMLGLMLTQLVPLPPALVKLLSPQSWEAYRPVLEQAGTGQWLPLTVNQKATVQELLRIGAYGLFYILAIQVLRTGERVRQVLLLTVLLGAAIAFLGILQQFSAGDRVYWFRPAPVGHPGGPWVNVNQYAAYLGAISPLALGLFLFYRPPAGDDTSLRERVVAFFSSPRSHLHLYLGFGFILLVSAVAVSLCRGGIVTVLLALILFILLAGYKRRSFSRMSFWMALCLVLLSITWFGWRPIFDEFGMTFDDRGAIRDARVTLWADSLQIVKDFPLVGGGFGTYNDVYPSYRTIPGNLVFDHAHNDFLELLTDGGLLGFALAAWFCAAVLVHGCRRIKMRRDRFAMLAGIGAITAIISLLLHSFVDFNLHNGAVGLYFFFLCGLLVAVVNTRYHHYHTESLLAVSPPRTGRLLGGGALLYTAAAVICQFGILVAGSSFNQVSTIYISSHLAPQLADRVADGLDRAITYDPFEAHYPFYRGHLAVYREGRERGREFYLQAARKKPMEGAYLQRLAMMLPPERVEEATRLMQEGYRRALNKEELVFGWAEWLLVTGRREQAGELLRERFRLDATAIVAMIPVLEAHRFSREEIAALLPPAVDAWIGYGDFMEKAGRLAEAEYFRSRSLDFLAAETEIKPHWFEQLIGFYHRRGQEDKALAVLRQAVEMAPDHAPFHIRFGDYYNKEGLTYLAKGEYERAVMLAPANESYRRRLRKLELDMEFGR